MDNKEHGTAAFQGDPYPASNLMTSSEDQAMITMMDSSIQLQTYQNYQEKGRSDLDNCVEAERVQFLQKHYYY